MDGLAVIMHKGSGHKGSGHKEGGHEGASMGLDEGVGMDGLAVVMHRGSGHKGGGHKGASMGLDEGVGMDGLAAVMHKESGHKGGGHKVSGLEGVGHEGGRLDKEGVCLRLGVSAERQERLEIFAALLVKWQARMNLVSEKSLRDLWHRHIFDSAQILTHLPPKTDKADFGLRIMDVGSGAGFPGLILAMLSGHELHLVEADKRKCAFLRVALRETGTKAIIHEERVENLPYLNMDVITGRAVASLKELLVLTAGQHHKDLTYIFLKGRLAQHELTQKPKQPIFEIMTKDSLTERAASLLIMREKVNEINEITHAR